MYLRSIGVIPLLERTSPNAVYLISLFQVPSAFAVTEQVWGVDLVAWMLRLAAGELPPLAELAAGLSPDGHAIHARVYAEDPARDFRPSPGLLTEVAFPPADGRRLRIDTWVEAGCEIPPRPTSGSSSLR